MSRHKLTVRDLEDSWACKHAQADLSSDERVNEIRTLLDEVRADAWDEGAETAWKATGDGHNGEYAHPFGTHDGTAPFQLANPNTPNPYRNQEEA